MSRKLLSIALLSTALATTGCGITYHSPTVKEAAAGVAVREVPLNAQSVLVANRSSYTPKRLPAAFYQTASGGSLRFGGALPAEPFVPQETPGTLELRPPPQICSVVPSIEIGVYPASRIFSDHSTS